MVSSCGFVCLSSLGDYEPGLRGDGWLWMSCEQLLSAAQDHKNMAFGVIHLNTGIFSSSFLQLLPSSWVEVKSYYNMFRLLLHLIKHLTCGSQVPAENPQKAKGSKLKGSKHQGTCSGRLDRKAGRSVILASSSPSLKNAERRACNSFCPSLLSTYSPLCKCLHFFHCHFLLKVFSNLTARIRSC